MSGGHRKYGACLAWSRGHIASSAREPCRGLVAGKGTSDMQRLCTTHRVALRRGTRVELQDGRVLHEVPARVAAAAVSTTPRTVLPSLRVSADEEDDVDDGLFS